MAELAFERITDINDLMQVDSESRLRDSDFDDNLWMSIMEVIDSPDKAMEFEEPVWVYVASRYIEWEVGNGGFGQAAYNISDWFPLAEIAYRKLGINKSADLIKKAQEIMKESGELRGEKFDATEIGELFQQFKESKLAELNERLDESGWWADETRLKYVRENRDAFRKAT